MNIVSRIQKNTHKLFDATNPGIAELPDISWGLPNLHGNPHKTLGFPSVCLGIAWALNKGSWAFDGSYV